MVLILAQAVIAILLIITILMQMQGSGISGAFGGSGEFYRSRRSIERFLMIATIVLSFLFAVLSLILLTNR